MSREIDSIDFDVNFQLYRATMYVGKIDVFVIKKRNNGTSYLSAIKTGSGTYKRVVKQLRSIAVRGSVLAEQLAECGA